MWCLINNKNHSHLKNVHQGWNTQAEIDLGKYYRVWCVVVPSQYDNSKFYICTTKSIENINRSQEKFWYGQY